MPFGLPQKVPAKKAVVGTKNMINLDDEYFVVFRTRQSVDEVAGARPIGLWKDPGVDDLFRYRIDVGDSVASIRCPNEDRLSGIAAPSRAIERTQRSRVE